MKDYRIHAPGTLTLHHLQISDAGNPLDTFLSIPTKAAIAALKDRKEQIKLDFVLDGDLRDPKFSLSESLSKKLAAGFAKVARRERGRRRAGRGRYGAGNRQRAEESAGAVARCVRVCQIGRFSARSFVSVSSAPV